MSLPATSFASSADEDTDSRLAIGQVSDQPVAVFLLKAQTLAMDGTQGPTTEGSGKQARRDENSHKDAISGTPTTLRLPSEDAYSVGLDVVVRLIPGLQPRDRAPSAAVLLGKIDSTTCLSLIGIPPNHVATSDASCPRKSRGNGRDYAFSQNRATDPVAGDLG